MLTRCRLYIFKLREELALYRGALSDAFRYGKASFTGRQRLEKPKGRLEGRIIAAYHVVEKGLSMPEMRPRFGEAMITSLQRMLKDYETYNEPDAHYQAGRAVIAEYYSRHKSIGIEVDDIITENYRTCDFCEFKDGGTHEVLENERLQLTQAPFDVFAHSRHSTRHFDRSKPISPEFLEKAIELGLRAPSACNRQPWKVYSLLQGEDVKKVMAHHSGSRGFGPDLPGVLVVAARMDTFSGPNERYQPFVDGGLFSMALMYALHFYGLGCVPLNWSVDRVVDLKLKKLIDVPDSENIVMLLGIGYPLAESRVPISRRRSLNEIHQPVADI